jgi:hypothetical protein
MIRLGGPAHAGAPGCARGAFGFESVFGFGFGFGLRLLAAVAWALTLALSSSSRGATWPVTSLGDDGPGTLRTALLDANRTPGEDRIEFAIEGTIALTTPLPEVAGNTIFAGPGPARLRLHGPGTGRVLAFAAGTTNRVTGLTLAGGRVTDGTPGGGILNRGTLVLVDCTVSDNHTVAGLGGGIYNAGHLVLDSCRIADNSVTGGDGQPGGGVGEGGGGGGLGGGVFSTTGSLVISNSVFEANRATGGNGGRRDLGSGNGNGGGPSGGRGGGSPDGAARGGYGGGGGGGAGPAAAGDGGVGGGGGGGGPGFPPMPAPGRSEFGGGDGGYASFAAGVGEPGGGGGGGGLGAAVFLADGAGRIVQSRFEGNRATGGNGGGRYPGGDGGGGFGAALFANGGMVELLDCLVTHNVALGGPPGGGHNTGQGGAAGGGGIFLRFAVSTISGCTIAANEARAAGSGSGSRGSTIGGEAHGGGLGFWGGRTHLANCTISENLVRGGNGGVVYAGYDGGHAWGGGLTTFSNITTAAHCTLTLNQAIGGPPGLVFPGLPTGVTGDARGGGIHLADGILHLVNSIVSDNTASEARTPDDVSGLVDRLGPNLIRSTRGLPSLGPLDLTGQDPRLGPLASNGGPTPTHALLPDSPALDAGLATAAPGFDQRRIARPAGPGVDLGAFEREPPGTPRGWVLVDGQPIPSGAVPHVGPADIAMQSSFPGSPIHYTLDGSVPSRNSPAYDGPFALVASATVRATVFSPDFLLSSEALPVRVTIVPPGSHTLAVTQSGQGTVVIDPPTGPYPAGSIVRLTALPAPSWSFARWSGDAAGSWRYLEIPMLSDRTIHAEFVPFVDYDFALTVEGQGTVTIEPNASHYPSNTVVRIVATEPRSLDTTGYWSFAGWSGGWSGNALTNSVLMDRPRRIVARFERISWDPPRFWVSESCPGGGHVVSWTTPPAPGAYPSNAIVQLMAVADPGWTLLHWMGDLEGTDEIVRFPATRNVRAIAVFATTPNYQTLWTETNGFPIAQTNDLARVLAPDLPRLPYAARFQLKVLPPAGQYLAGWTGAYDGGWEDPTLDFESYSPSPFIIGMFRALPPGTATLTAAARGLGTINASHSNALYSVGLPVSLTAVPDPDQAFLGWSGDATGTDPTIRFTLDSSRTIFADFTERPRLRWVDAFGFGTPDSLRLEIEGRARISYHLERSTDLRSWERVQTVSVPGGTRLLGIPGSSTGTAVFYRAVEAGP